jgi:serine/threonine-protein kinase HipA
MRLASLIGLNVASVALTKSSKKDVLLIERFDRNHTGQGWQRKCMVSALTLLGLDEMMARYASYQDLSEIIRHKFTDASLTLKELFSRLVFNILSGNTDDHARNHAAFWDGQMLTLTPAYDICPQPRSGNVASQAMLISEDNRMSRISACLEAAHHFLLSEKAAAETVEHQIFAISKNWYPICEEADLSETDRALLWGRQYLKPFAFDELERDFAIITKLAREMRTAKME